MSKATCETCGKVCSSPHGLKIHMSRAHDVKSEHPQAVRQRAARQAGPSEHVCEVCGSEHATAFGLTMHKTKLHGSTKNGLAVKTSRPRKQRESIEVEGEVEEEESDNAELNWCPRCGYEMDLIRRFVAATPHTCPGCKLGLAVISSVINHNLMSLDRETAENVISAAAHVARIGGR